MSMLRKHISAMKIHQFSVWTHTCFLEQEMHLSSAWIVTLVSSALVGCVLLPTIEITSKSVKQLHLHLQESASSSFLWLFVSLICLIWLETAITLEVHVTLHSTQQKIWFCSFPLYFISAVTILGSTMGDE